MGRRGLMVGSLYSIDRRRARQLWRMLLVGTVREIAQGDWPVGQPVNYRKWAGEALQIRERFGMTCFKSELRDNRGLKQWVTYLFIMNA